MGSKGSERLAFAGFLPPQFIDDNTAQTERVDMGVHYKLVFAICTGQTDSNCTVQLKEATSSAGAGEQSLGSAVTITGAAGDNTVKIIDVEPYRLSEGFTHVSVHVTQANGSSGAAITILPISAGARYSPESDYNLGTVTDVTGTAFP